jgi:hypothetical protein
MTIPHIKQSYNRRLHPPHGPTGKPPGPAQHDAAPSPKQAAPGQNLAVARALPALAFILITITMAPGASAIVMQITEDFESYLQFSVPTGTGKEYMFTGNGLVVPPPTGSTGANGANVLRHTAGATGNHFDFADSVCPTTGSSFRFDVYFDSFPTGGLDAIGIQETSGDLLSTGGGGSTLQAFFVVDSTGQLFARQQIGVTTTQSATITAALAPDTWHTLAITCGTSTTTFLNVGTGEFQQISGTVVSADTDFFSTQAHTSSGHIYLDNLRYSQQVPVPGSRFCANPNDPPMFEYTYVSGWEFFEDFGFDTDDGFLSEASSTASETDFMAKGFNTGSKAFSIIVRIEAGVDGDQSLFGLAFTKGIGGLPSGSNRGTGLEPEGFDGGNFDNSLQVVFQETVGNEWLISLTQNLGGTLTTLGASVEHGDSNAATTYNFTVNSETGIVSVKDETGATIIERNMNVAFQDAVWLDSWIGASANLVLFNDALTVLDDPDQDETESIGIAEDSTCIFDLIGDSVVNGGSGLTPPSTVPPPVNNGGGSGGGGGGELAFLDSPYFWVVLWIVVVEILLAALSWGSRAGFGGQVYLIAGMGVYIIGILLSKGSGEEISPWPIVAILGAIIGLAIWRR